MRRGLFIKIDLSKGQGMMIDTTDADNDVKYTEVYDSAGHIPYFMVGAR